MPTVSTSGDCGGTDRAAQEGTKAQPPACNNSGQIARPVWFGDEERPAFGWFHSPADGFVRGGVVICPPLGFDYLHGHYALRLLAERLAVAGFCALRFDYEGTGDSAGGNDDPGRLDAWIATVRFAVSLVREAGVDEVCVVGMRVGAALAAEAVATEHRIDQVVLWDPCSGRAFLREQRAISTITLGSTAGSPDGSLEIPGVVYDATTATEIEGLSIEKCSLPLARRVLVLTRADRPANRQLLAAPLAGEELLHEEAIGQAEFMDRYPPFQELPHVAIGRIVGWLCEGAWRQAVVTRALQLDGPCVVGRGSPGCRIVEAPVSVPPVGLFGILTYGENVPSASDTPTAIFLNVANQHHVGPSRLWVELAREWAMAGIRSLRLDMSGLGDSPSRQGEHGRWECNKPDAFDDVMDAASWVSPGDPSNVVIVGLCSAAYQALESALEVRARGVVAINPIVSLVPVERRAGLPLDARRRIVLPKDEVTVISRRGEHLAGMRERFPGLTWRARMTASLGGRRSGKWLTELVGQGTETLLVCGDAELRPIRQGVTAMQLHRLYRTGRLRLEHLAGLQHDLFIADQRSVVTRLVTEHVLSRFSGQSYQPRASRTR
ncbi:MAG: alpha/beta fold hydrolase [Acidimicrobiales bacterium]|jgi:alpha-beta hydrolase superfamily lysophospholipase